MKEQVLRLAPAHATGYRLVLPAAQDGARPKLAPRRQNGDPRSCYRVSPFEYPLDVRLRDGKWYRILWVDREGQAVNSSPELGVPSLYFFLGTPDAISLATTQYVAEVPALTRDAEDSQSVKLLTAQSVNVDTEPPTVEAERPVEAPMLSVAPTSAVAEEIPAAPAPIEAESHSLSQETAQPTPNQTEIPAVAANPFVAMTETAPIAGIGGTAQKTPMEKPPLDPFWDSIGKHATRLESLAQVLYEQRLATAKEEGRPLPSEPLTQLSRDERKDIRRAASHPFWQSLGSYLNSRFARARRKGIGAVASLKLAPTPLSDSDQRLIDEVLASPDKRRYLDYLHARRDALLVGDTLPKEPVSKLAAAQRKRLVKLVADVRPIVESLALNDEE